jgi:5'(3')-deoxyribonucleotidase
MNKIIYLDLDGVLTNFTEAVLEKFQRTIPMRERRWDIGKQLGIPDHEFYAALDYDFWVSLKWTTEGPTLLHRLEKTVNKENIVICTSPVRTKGCVDGKIDWIQHNLSGYKWCITKYKAELAHADACLIDDKDENCQQFNIKGTAILVPRPWNILKALTCPEFGTFKINHVIEQVKEFVQ